MEQKQFLMSALSLGIGVGVGVGVGFGLVSEPAVSRWFGSGSAAVMAERVEQEMMNLVVEGKGTGVSFDDFPYYLSEKTRALLTGAACVHLMHEEFSKFSKNITLASKSILLSGPSELYLQMLAKGIANCFDAKVLILDVPDLSYKVRCKYGGSRNNTTSEDSSGKLLSEGTRERLSSFLGSLSKKWGSESEYATTDIASLASSVSVKNSNNWEFDEKSFTKSLYKVLLSVSKTGRVVLYVRDVDKVMHRSERLPSLFHKMICKLSGPILILGSRIVNDKSGIKSISSGDELSLPFPHELAIVLPENDLEGPKGWKKQLEEDTKAMKLKENRNHIAEVLAENDVECDDLGSVTDMEELCNHIEEIVIVSVSYHLMNNKDPEYRNGRLLISSKSLAHGLSQLHGKDAKNATPDNKFEKRLRPQVTSAKVIDVKFSDIGALDDVKQSLQELVAFPLRRPDLFTGSLLRPCGGILLFGPPGSGKTMLAKALAKESGAAFINLSTRLLTSKWFPEDEKNVKAIFSLAKKLSPAIIFIDQVDSMPRSIRNNFVADWDVLLAKSNDRIVVLAATNRPFDLDETFVRRFDRRIMIGLPSLEEREKIFKTILAKDKIEGLDFKELANMTEGYSGGDLKNLCTAAAYQPVRELLLKENEKGKEKEKEKEKGKGKGKEKEREKEKEKEKKTNEEEKAKTEDGKSETDKSEEEQNKDKGDEPPIQPRPLTMEDMLHAINQVSRSTIWMPDFEQWNDRFGEGGSKKKKCLTYFL